MSSHSESDSGTSEMYSTESETETQTESETATETESDASSDVSSDVTDSASSYGSDDESIDSQEEDAKRRAKDGGVSDDPFQKRIPQSFYDHEKKKLGPLEKPWEQAIVGKKTYYANHKTKTTSWIDPRTEKTRNKDIMKCKMGELPYGWDEEIDPEIGVYYVDHNTQSTFLDPPWDPRVQFQVSQLSKFLADQIALYKKKLAELQTENEIKEDEKKKEIKKLNDEKKRIQNELEELRKKAALSDDSDSDDEPLPTTIAEFQNRLKDLMNLQQKLNNPGQVDEVEEFKQTQEEILRVQQMLEEEERNRLKILDDIEKLKGEITNVITASDSSPDSQYSDTPKARDNAPRPPQLTRKTRYEMEVELLMLKKKLVAEKQQNQRLQAIQGKVQDKEGALPQWIKKIEEVATSSKTLRVKISQKQAQGPDALSFRERMLFFASNVAESKAPAKAPPPPVKRS